MAWRSLDACSSEDLKCQLFQPLHNFWDLSRAGVLGLGFMNGNQGIYIFSEIIGNIMFVCVCVQIFLRKGSTYFISLFKPLLASLFLQRINLGTSSRQSSSLSQVFPKRAHSVLQRSPCLKAFAKLDLKFSAICFVLVQNICLLDVLYINNNVL